jgi:hypothetical protein
MKYSDVSEVRTASITSVMTEAVVYYETSRRYIPQSYHLHTGRRENLKSHYHLLGLFNDAFSAAQVIAEMSDRNWKDLKGS